MGLRRPVPRRSSGLTLRGWGDWGGLGEGANRAQSPLRPQAEDKPPWARRLATQPDSADCGRQGLAGRVATPGKRPLGHHPGPARFQTPGTWTGRPGSVPHTDAWLPGTGSSAS